MMTASKAAAPRTAGAAGGGKEGFVTALARYHDELREHDRVRRWRLPHGAVAASPTSDGLRVLIPSMVRET
jgi:hypothetical protein